MMYSAIRRAAGAATVALLALAAGSAAFAMSPVVGGRESGGERGGGADAVEAPVGDGPTWEDLPQTVEPDSSPAPRALEAQSRLVESVEDLDFAGFGPYTLFASVTTAEAGWGSFALVPVREEGDTIFYEARGHPPKEAASAGEAATVLAVRIPVGVREVVVRAREGEVRAPVMNTALRFRQPYPLGGE